MQIIKKIQTKGTTELNEYTETESIKKQDNLHHADNNHTISGTTSNMTKIYVH
jgi:hypothetical protein